MSGARPDQSKPLDLRERALSRWENEGGAEPEGPQHGGPLKQAPPEIDRTTNTEMIQLRVRIIALENLLIALLAGSSDQELATAREMAGYIAPRPGATHHPLTIAAGKHMVDLVERADRLRP
jgi:hypothetical protein